MAFAIFLKIGVLLSHSILKHFLKSWQIWRICQWCGNFRGWCYPIESQAIHQVFFEPNDGANESHKARVATNCTRFEFDVPHDQMRKECRPYLPLNRFFVLPEEVLKLKCLLKLLEQNLDLPSWLVKVRNGRCCPLEIVGKENKVVPIPVYLDMSRDSSQRGRIGFFCFNPC